MFCLLVNWQVFPEEHLCRASGRERGGRLEEEVRNGMRDSWKEGLGPKDEERDGGWEGELL